MNEGGRRVGVYRFDGLHRTPYAGYPLAEQPYRVKISKNRDLIQGDIYYPNRWNVFTMEIQKIALKYMMTLKPNSVLWRVAHAKQEIDARQGKAPVETSKDVNVDARRSVGKICKLSVDSTRISKVFIPAALK
jgi:hypothetical protein